MAKNATIWRTELGSGEINNANLDVERTTEAGVTRTTEAGVTRVLEDSVVTQKANTSWSVSDS